jgi:DNA-binding Lrp family transcriptional regulator
VDESKLGGSERHIIVMKFLHKPTEQFLTNFFKNDKFAQDVYMLDGAFDLFIYARVGDPVSYIRWETYIASELSEYRPIMQPSEFVVAHMGFWPLNDMFVNDISKTIKLDEKDRQMLTLLNQNSRMSILEMSKRIHMDKGTVRYRLLGLQRSGIVKRFTIAVQSPPQDFKILHFSNYRFNENINQRMLELRKEYMAMDANEMPVLGVYQVVAPMSGSYRSVGLSLFYNETDAVQAIEMHRRIFKKDNIDIVYAKITKVVKGLLPARNLDIKKHYLPIVWSRNDEPVA